MLKAECGSRALGALGGRGGGLRKGTASARPCSSLKSSRCCWEFGWPLRAQRARLLGNAEGRPRAVQHAAPLQLLEALVQRGPGVKQAGRPRRFTLPATASPPVASMS